jgi:hypothetical protein
LKIPKKRRASIARARDLREFAKIVNSMRIVGESFG